MVEMLCGNGVLPQGSFCFVRLRELSGLGGAMRVSRGRGMTEPDSRAGAPLNRESPRAEVSDLDPVVKQGEG